MSRRALEAVPEGRTFDRPTVRLLVRARRALAVAAALGLLQLRTDRHRHHVCAALVQQLRIDLARLDVENRYLRDRLARIPPGHRSRYTPVERFRILTFVRTYGLSVAGAAARFLVTPKTIARWFAEATAHPDRRTIGSLLRAVPPIRRYADVVRDLVQEMDVWGFGGNRRIAHTLARAGVQLGRETVRRYRTGPRRLPTAPRDQHGPLVPSRPNHVWLIDLTTVRRWLGLVSYQILVVLDGYSRLPLAARVFTTAPRARDIACVFRRAVRAHGAPRVLVSGRAKVFRSKTLRARLRPHRIQHRFGAVGQPGSIAILERFWRTLKALLRDDRPTLFVDVLERRLATALLYYSVHRPHAGLGGATPLERHLGLTPAHTFAQPPARDRPIDTGTHHLTIDCLDDEGRFPILVRRAA